MNFPDWMKRIAGINVESKDTYESFDISGVGTLKLASSGPTFSFNDRYLLAVLNPIDVSSYRPPVFKDSTPVRYTVSASKLNEKPLILNWYPKVATAEGIVENVALVEHADRYYVVPDCDETRFAKLCRKLNPTLEDLGYERRAGQLAKSGKVVEIFFDTPADAAAYQKATVPSAPPEQKPVPPLPDKLQEAGKELLKAPEPKTLSQIKMDEGSEMMEGTASLKTEAKKKQKEIPQEDSSRNGQDEYSLSRWDKKEPSEKPQSAASVISLKFDSDHSTYSVKFPQGTRLNVSFETMRSYLVGEGYALEEANKLLEDAKKDEVVLRKEAGLKKSAQLNKFIEVQAEEKNIKKIANLLKDSKTRRSIFSNLVLKSFKNKEISEKDFHQYRIALIAAEYTKANEDWEKLAEISETIFEKVNG